MPTSTGLVPLTLEMADALLAGDDVFTDRFGMPVAAGYLDVPDVLPAVRDAIAAGTPPEWYSHLVVDRERDLVVGFSGYKGPPAEGAVEIGYSVAPEHRRRGHATRAVHLLVGMARERGVARVRAHTVLRESPSTRVLERCGFARVGTVVDAGLGKVWRFELALRG